MEFCHANRIDIVQSFFRDSNLAATLWARKARVPVIIASRRNIGAGYWHNSREIAILKFLRRFTTHYITNSQAAADETRRVEKVSAEKITVMPNGLDMRPYLSVDPSDAIGIKERWGLDPASPVVGAVANLRNVKNLPFLVKAAPDILKRFPGVGFVVLGEGDERTALERLVEERGLKGKFLLPGRSDDVVRDLQAIDVAVLCSHGESLSNSLMEYMAAGRPAVASDVGGNRELLHRPELGYIYPADNRQEFVNDVCDLLENPDKRHLMGQAARREIESAFSWPRVLERLETLYQRLVSPVDSQSRGREQKV